MHDGYHNLIQHGCAIDHQMELEENKYVESEAAHFESSNASLHKTY